MKYLVLIFAFFFISCGVKLAPPESFTPKSLNESEFKDLNLSRANWWGVYKDEKINEFVDFILLNNADINIARTSLLSAMARTNLLNYELYPNLNANFAINKGLNLNSGISSERTFSNSLSLNYEVDIYAKLLDSARSGEFSAMASAYDLEALRLSLINTALNGIFELAYFNDVEILLKNYILNLEQMRELFLLKYELGKIEQLTLLNTEQSLLKARQSLLNNEQNRNALIKSLKDLMLDESGVFYINYFANLSLDNFELLKPNFNIPLNAFSYRPDVKAALNKLKAAFKDYSAVQKSLLPSINFNTNLSGNDESFNDSFKFEILNGALQISLPFLNYHKIRQNIKISQYTYEGLVFGYKNALQVALNEFWLNELNYFSNVNMYENLSLIKAKQELITQAYLMKYELGKSELKDYLDALNMLNQTSQELLRARYNLLYNVNFYYQITSLNYEEIGLEYEF